PCPTTCWPQPTWSDKRINAEQRTAVRAILKGDHAPLPYLIFGPPGTGKTMTATEAAAQVFKLDPNSRLLLCAPSNSAADLLAQRVMDKGLLRVCAFSRPVEDLPIALKPVSNWREANREEAGAFAMPDKERIMDKYIRVVAVTCLMAAKLHAQGVPAGHFTHIFIDEAGHAEEPLTLAATAGLLAADSTARLVLAGDPQQLGPIILSPLAQRYGLAVSAMERLISSAPYAASGQEGSLVYNSTFVTKLLTNYRSHPCILRLPNALFYMNDLVVGADMSVTHGCVGKMGFKGLEGRGLERSNLNFPIIFHHVVGKDEREGNSPSWKLEEAAGKLAGSCWYTGSKVVGNWQEAAGELAGSCQ
ncbi:C2H2-type domain-containing protein, partial [Haematococcus lacustris]